MMTRRSHRALLPLILLALLLVAAPCAFAACTGPAGTAGQIVYNEDHRIMQYCDNTDWVKMGPQPYLPNAVEFDGSSNLQTSAVNGYTDSTKYTVSLWFRIHESTPDVGATLLENDSGRIQVRVDTRGTDDNLYSVYFQGKTSADTVIVFSRTSEIIKEDQWYHMLASVDTATGQAHLYLDDVSDIIGAPSAGTMDIAGTFWRVVTLGSLVDLADVWFESDLYIDFSNEENRRRFIDANGYPVNLGTDGSNPTGTAPDIFLSGDTVTWHTNKGTGGGFTENGALTDAATTPLDRTFGDYANGLVAHWTFNETSGTTITDSVGGFNGTFSGEAAVNSISGTEGTAIYLDATDDVITIPHNAALMPAGVYSYSFWVKSDANAGLGGQTGVIGKGDGYVWYFDDSGGGHPGVCQHGNPFERSWPVEILSANDWYLVTCTYDGSTLRSYINTREVGTTASTPLVGNTDPLLIGGVAGWNKFAGAVDDLRFYNRILAPDDVKALYFHGNEICENPDGAAGQITYNRDRNTMQFCNGNSWLTMNPVNEPTDGLVGHWKFDEGSGTTAVDAINGNDAALQNASSANWVMGHLGNAVSLNGSNQYGLGAANNAQTITGDLTLSVWAYRNAAGAVHNFVDYANAGETEAANHLYQLWIGADNVLRLEWEYGGGSNAVITASAAVSEPSGSWVNYLVTRDAATKEVKFYENGVQIGSTQSYANNATGGSTGFLTIAAENNGSASFNGRLDDFRIYNRVLSTAEITDLYHVTGGNRAGDTQAGLVGYWPMNELEGSSAADMAGTNDGTLTAGVTFRSTGGVIEGAIDFPGLDSQSLSLGDVHDFAGTAPFTVSFWTYVRSYADAYPRLITKVAGDSSTLDRNGWSITIHDGTGDPSHKITCNRWLNNAQQNKFVGGGLFPLNSWTHVVCSYDGNEIKVFLDGSQQGAGAASTASLTDNTANLTVGGRPAPFGANGESDALVDDLRIYNRALAASEIKAIYDAGAAGKAEISCTSPDGAEGQMIFNTDNNVMQFCNGESWIGVKGHGDVATLAAIAAEPPTANRVQYKMSTETDPASVTMDATPTQGNLLVAIAAHRREAGGPTISGTGWTLHFSSSQHTFADLGHTSSRRGLAIWSKIAGASEPTAITVDFGDGVNRLLVQEFAITGGTPAFDVSAYNMGPESATTTSLSTGTTASSSTANSLIVTAVMSRDAMSGTTSWTNGVAGDIGTNSTVSLHSGYVLDSTAGAKSSTASWSTALLPAAGIVVFSITP